MSETLEATVPAGEVAAEQASEPTVSIAQLGEALVASWNIGAPFPRALCTAVSMESFQVALIRFAGQVSFTVLMLDKLQAATRNLPRPMQHLAAITLLSQFGIDDDLGVSPGTLVFTIRPNRVAEHAALRIVPAETLIYGCLRFYRWQDAIQLRWTLGYAGVESGHIRIGNGKRVSRMYDLALPPGLKADRFLVSEEEGLTVTPDHPAVRRANASRLESGINPDLYPRAGIKHLDLEDDELCQHAIQSLTALRAQALINQCNHQLADFANRLRREVTELMRHPDAAGPRAAEVRLCLESRMAAAQLFIFGDLSLPPHYLRFVTANLPPVLEGKVLPDPVLPDASLLSAAQLAARNDGHILGRLASRPVIDLDPLDEEIGRWHFQGQVVRAVPDQQSLCWAVLRPGSDEPEMVAVDDFASARRYYLPQIVDYGRRLFREDFMINVGGVYVDLGDWLVPRRATS